MMVAIHVASVMMVAGCGCMATMEVIDCQRAHLRWPTSVRHAKRHGCRSVCLKRHREHHEPQQDRAKADHVRIVGEASVLHVLTEQKAVCKRAQDCGTSPAAPAS